MLGSWVSGGFGSGADPAFSMACWVRFAGKIFTENRFGTGWLSGFDWVRDFASLRFIFKRLEPIFLALVLFPGEILGRRGEGLI